MVNKIFFVYIISIVIATLLSYILKSSGVVLVAGLAATVYLIPTFHGLRKVEGFRVRAEGFENPEIPMETFTVDTESGPAPLGKNPFNNVTVDEYKYAPTRNAAPDITTPQSKLDLDQFFRVQWSSDPTDVFGKAQDQRMFVTQPVTTIPNDQKSYQDWLYKIPGKTCKEGNPDACYGGTNGAALPWLNL